MGISQSISQGSALSRTLTDGHIFVGNSSNIATDVAMSGDVTIIDTGVTTIKTDVALAGSPTTTTQSNNDSSTKIATTAFVQSLIALVGGGFTFETPCYTASTANLNATYNNGAAGVGATLTNAGTLAAFSVDGQSPPINSRILIKDQTTTSRNGIYTLTTVGSGAVAWVLTRATDYDSAAEIKQGSLVPVINGTSNMNSVWLQTASVTTVGTDPITFQVFVNPSNVTITGGTIDNTTIGGITPAAGSFTTLNASGLTASELLATDGSKNLQSLDTATYPSLTETSYVKGVTSAIQTQLNAKAASGANTDITSVLLNQTGLVVKGATSNALTLKPNETLSAARTLSVVVNDANRSLTIAGDATISGTNTGDQTNISGNAGTATALQNARNIGAVSFDGTANIVPQTIQTVDESSDTTCFPLFSNASGSQTSGQQPKTNSGLTYNSSTNNLGATTFTGAVSGNATTATTLATARAIYGNNFDGSAALTQVIASTYGGTGNGFAKLSGPTTSEKTFTLPNASSTILTDNAAVTVAQGGTGLQTLTTAYGVVCAGTTATANLQNAGVGTSGQVLTSNGSSALPTWQAAPVSTGQIVNSVFTSATAVASSTGTAIDDDTIPQLSECPVLTDYNTTYTGTSGNKLRFEAVMNLSANTANRFIVCIFVDSNTSASAAARWEPSTSGADCPCPCVVRFELTLSDSSSHTYKIGVGGVSGAVATINGVSGSRKLGGVMYSSLEILEIKA